VLLFWLALELMLVLVLLSSWGMSMLCREVPACLFLIESSTYVSEDWQGVLLARRGVSPAHVVLGKGEGSLGAEVRRLYLTAVTCV